ncbi:lysine N(6)-hydroxylase/L-ornithine N(5)-oxygenase family protein [Nonomuraea rhizosphaerae]|uniref:lysine N(6)-hydroxylase/L-ornithine N(5)-oxygenase family protein n=1 Tax=Nonomuraea rhizosphaerae TaxID=2665663 RepID=UPI001C5F1714|nr:SidA/IucD/PvdA family monooxygenase [Nonomuraea rhizosphaerae]
MNRRTRQSPQECDFIGVGVGPANLSLAALSHPVPWLRGVFMERREQFQWHPGLMLPRAQLQVSYLKDLVTLVDPTSRYSFLNYLATQRRLYRFLVASRDGCSRQEYETYCRWVAAELRTIRWGCQVEGVQLHGPAAFEVRTVNGGRFRSRTVVVGTGRTPAMPDFARRLRGSRVLHSADLLTVNPRVRAKDVLVVGAGQSAAETFLHLSCDDSQLPKSLTWLSSGPGFQPLDDSPFTNEWFNPSYVGYFHRLSPARREGLLREQRLASNGISQSLLQAIYRRLYDLDVQDGERMRHRLLTSRRLLGLEERNGRVLASVHDLDLDRTEVLRCDVVICATGYTSDFPAYLEPIRGRFSFTGRGFDVREDYSVRWDAPAGLQLFVQNAAEHTHGVADPNLSLLSWRSARILNALAGQEVYDIEGSATTITWERDGRPHSQEDGRSNGREALWAHDRKDTRPYGQDDDRPYGREDDRPPGQANGQAYGREGRRTRCQEEAQPNGPEDDRPQDRQDGQANGRPQDRRDAQPNGRKNGGPEGRRDAQLNGRKNGRPYGQGDDRPSGQEVSQEVGQEGCPDEGSQLTDTPAPRHPSGIRVRRGGRRVAL